MPQCRLAGCPKGWKAPASILRCLLRAGVLQGHSRQCLVLLTKSQEVLYHCISGSGFFIAVFHHSVIIFRPWIYLEVCYPWTRKALSLPITYFVLDFVIYAVLRSTRVLTRQSWHTSVTCLTWTQMCDVTLFCLPGPYFSTWITEITPTLLYRRQLVGG